MGGGFVWVENTLCSPRDKQNVINEETDNRAYERTEVDILMLTLTPEYSWITAKK